jgi:hypothetical protein
VTALVQPDPQHDDLDDLQGRIAELDATLRNRRLELDGVKADLDAFKIRYRQRVGLLHEELDELELRLAEAELGELSKRLDEAGASKEPPGAAPQEATPRFTTDAVRKLFRDVAKFVHPDLARDDAARRQRHALMVAANRAYALGDEEQLRGILQDWQRSPEAVVGMDEAAVRLRLERRVAQSEEQLERLDQELEALRQSPLGRLKTMVDAAMAQGKDLVADMVRRLQRDILVARNRLEALTWTPRE